MLPSGALEITNVNIGDRASYSCRVAEITSPAAELKLQALPESAAPAPPSFLQTPVNVRLLRGEQTTLECAANGVPQPTITWLKDGKRLDLESLDSVYKRTGEGSLTILSAGVGEEGGYQCRAENSEDSLDSAVEVSRGVRLIQTSTLIGQEVQLSSFCPIKKSRNTNNNALIG